MKPVRNMIPVSTRKAPMIFSTVPRCLRKRFMKARKPLMAKAASRKGTPSPAE